MKGRNVFTKEDFEKIEQLVIQKALTPQSKQKGIRQKLRKLNFYCSDFDTSGEMTIEALKKLLMIGRIKIVDIVDFDLNTKKSNTKAINSTMVSPNLKDSKKGLPPMVGNSPKVLILGTMPGEESLRSRAYYRNTSHNKFWEIIHTIYSDETDVSYEELLKKKHIALWDCIKLCKRKGSTDKGFDKESLVPNDLEAFLRENPTIELIILNGKGDGSNSTKTLFYRFFKSLSNKYLILPLDSTSNANATISLDEKIKQWSVIRKYN